MGSLEATSFAVQSTYRIIKVKSPSQLVFIRDMIFPVKNVEDEIVSARNLNRKRHHLQKL